MSSNIAYIDKIENKREWKSDIIDKINSICQGKSTVMISVFDILKDQFVYCSDAIEKNLGYCCKDVCKGGWKGWFEKIDSHHSTKIKKSILYYIENSVLLRKQKPLHLTYHIIGRTGNAFQVHHEIMPYHFRKELILINFLYDTTQHEMISLLFGKPEADHRSNGMDELNISPRENEVMLLIAEGLSSKQIAGQLFISIQTVLTHRKHLLEKFSAKNTAQLINKAASLQKFQIFPQM